MSARGLYKKIPTKAVSGPGGIRCACCRGCLATVKRARIVANRILRRTRAMDKCIGEVFDA